MTEREWERQRDRVWAEERERLIKAGRVVNVPRPEGRVGRWAQSIWDWVMGSAADNAPQAQAPTPAEDKLPPAVSTALAQVREGVTLDMERATTFLAGEAAAAAGKAMAEELAQTVDMMREQADKTQHAVRQLGERYQSHWEMGVTAFIEAEARRKMQLEAGDNQQWYDVLLARVRTLEERVEKLEQENKPNG